MFKKESTADSKTISTLRKKSLLLSRSSLRWKKAGFRRSSNFWSSQLRFVSSNCFFFFFFECEHPFIDKTSQRSKRLEVPSYDKTDDHK